MSSASERQIKGWELTTVIGRINVADDLAEDRWGGVDPHQTGKWKNEPGGKVKTVNKDHSFEKLYWEGDQQSMSVPEGRCELRRSC